MATLVRSAKSGSDWSFDDLHSYNITIEQQDFQTFFNLSTPPRPGVDAEVLAHVSGKDMVQLQNCKLLRYMDLAMDPAPGEESAVSDFMVRLMMAMGYETRERDIRCRQSIPLFTCGQWKYAKADVCLMHNHEIRLLVFDNKRRKEPNDAPAKLVAQAIAAFQSNNSLRPLLNLPNINSKTIPGILMSGSSPIFFKIPVSSDLVEHVEIGRFPSNRTIVTMHVPDIHRPDRRLAEGLRPLDNREHILSCFEAFKNFIE